MSIVGGIIVIVLLVGTLVMWLIYVYQKMNGR